MNTLKCISKIFESAKQILINSSSKIVLMSDCHRGDGNWGDNFSKNQNIYFEALTYYYNNQFTYIEIGDGDELWENKKFSVIANEHSDALWLLSKYYKRGRLYFIFGNHDMVKRNNTFVEKNLYRYFDEREKEYIPLFNNIIIHEGIVLRDMVTNNKILLIHGHQVDYMNNQMWRLNRFLVRYLWRPLELFGVNDPTRTAKNYKKKEAVDKKLSKWAIKEKHMIICGHTHRPMFPDVGEPPYFNDGSCVHPRCITAIEIEKGSIVLVKWDVKTKIDGTLYITREVLAGPRKLTEYFNK